MSGTDKPALNLFDEKGNAGKITHGKDGSGNVYSGTGVSVDNGSFTMYGGSIEGNTADGSGGGVYVDSGSFTMNDGSIEGNTADGSGGGVYAYGSSITMNGGSIEGNSADFYGGGVSVNNGSFTMNDGSIEGNTAAYGGGALMDGCTFTMKKGSIKSNTATNGGGGAYAYYGTFTMSGGSIESNTTTNGSGAGLYAYYSSITMKDGSIKSNTATDGVGGGAYIVGKTFTMNGGTISGNQADHGGGVYVDDDGSFTMNGGTISGNNAQSGGGVLNFGQFNMNGGTISVNQAKVAGGGVCNIGNFYMGEGLELVPTADTSASAPEITGNTAPYGGGVLTATERSFFMDGGVISHNNASKNGGGVLACSSGVMEKFSGLVNQSSVQESAVEPAGSGSGFILSGAPTITDNQSGEGKDNVALVVVVQSDMNVLPAVINVADKLTNTTPIGVNLLEVSGLQQGSNSVPTVKRTGGVFTNGLPGSGNGAYGDASNFVSDSEDFGVCLVEDGDQKGEAQLLPAVKASAEDVTVNYDGKAHSITVKTETEGAKVVYSTDDGKTWSETNPSFTEAGKYTVSYQAKADGYAPATGKATVTIKGGAVKASAEDVTATYDGKAHSITVTTEPKGAKVSYSTDGKTWSGKNPGFTDAGEYTVSYKAEAEGSAPATGKATVTINAKAVTATADNKSSVYNKTLAALTFTVTGLVKDADQDSLKITASTKAKKGSDVGMYDITLKQDTTKASENYKVTLKKGTYTITKATQRAPAAPKVSHKYWTYFTVKKVTGLEYTLRGKKWGSSRTFENLSPGMTYKVYARKAADKNHFASKASKVTKVRLPAAHLSANAAQTGSTLTVKWSKDPKANSYDVYVWYCGDKKPTKPTVTKTKKADSAIITKLKDENLDTSKSITVKVVAKKNNVAVAKSLALHVAGSGSRNKTNATGINGIPKKNRLVLRLNKSKTLNLTVRKNGKRELLDEEHGAAIRLVSSDDRIITVDGTTVKAVGKGTCTVYVCTLNGIENTIEITVK